MALPSIDGLTFTGWRGRLHHAVRRIARLPPRPGINGEAWVMDGWATNPEPIVTRAAFANDTLAAAEIASYRALMDGSTVVAVDPVGQSFNIKVVEVIAHPNFSADGTYVVEATWKTQVEAAP